MNINFSLKIVTVDNQDLNTDVELFSFEEKKQK